MSTLSKSIAILMGYLLVLAPLNQCTDEKSDGKVKSMTGIKAGQVDDIAAGKDKYPTFIAFSDWYDGYQITEQADSLSQVSFEELQGAIRINDGADYGFGFSLYLSKEIEKLEALIAKLEITLDEEEIKQFIQDDTTGLKEILMAVFGEEFANGASDQWASHIALQTEEFRKEIFSGFLTNSTVKTDAELEEERLAYEEALNNLYNKDESSRGEFLSLTKETLTHLKAVQTGTTPAASLVNSFLTTVIVGGIAVVALYTMAHIYLDKMKKDNESGVKSEDIPTRVKSDCPPWLKDSAECK